MTKPDDQRSYTHGVPSWVDLEQPDTQAAAEFYSGLFGWDFEEAMPATPTPRWPL